MARVCIHCGTMMHLSAEHIVSTFRVCATYLAGPHLRADLGCKFVAERVDVLSTYLSQTGSQVRRSSSALQYELDGLSHHIGGPAKQHRHRGN